MSTANLNTNKNTIIKLTTLNSSLHHQHKTKEKVCFCKHKEQSIEFLLTLICFKVTHKNTIQAHLFFVFVFSLKKTLKSQ